MGLRVTSACGQTGFNGAALNCAEKAMADKEWVDLECALQWGRAELRGKGAMEEEVSGQSSSFNGAALNCAEKGTGTSSGPCECTGFNGAALNCAEKGPCTPCATAPKPRFNGAALNCAEKVIRTEAGLDWGWLLQWGRAELRGKGPPSWRQSTSRACGFNGAALNCAEKGGAWVSSRASVMRFNGAALNCAEKGSLAR